MQAIVSVLLPGLEARSYEGWDANIGALIIAYTILGVLRGSLL